MLGELCVQDRTQISWAGVEGIPQQPLAGHSTGLNLAFISSVCYENVGKQAHHILCWGSLTSGPAHHPPYWENPEAVV